MPSVITLEGNDLGRTTPKVGYCKTVKNPRTGCEVSLCYVGKAKSRTGWKFLKGSSRCPRKAR